MAAKKRWHVGPTCPTSSPALKWSKGVFCSILKVGGCMIPGIWVDGSFLNSATSSRCWLKHLLYLFLWCHHKTSFFWKHIPDIIDLNCICWPIVNTIIYSKNKAFFFAYQRLKFIWNYRYFSSFTPYFNNVRSCVPVLLDLGFIIIFKTCVHIWLLTGGEN